VKLEREAALKAVRRLADELELDPTACAQGIIRVANAEMVRALRVVTVERGIDPRGYALLAFGGAGGLHAAAIADELEIDTILCPRASGVLAALGLVVSPRRRDVQRSVLLEEPARDHVAEIVEELGEQARREVGNPRAELRPVYEVRYKGQSFELRVESEDLREAFEAHHEERYGYRDQDSLIELVTVRVSASVPSPQVSLAGVAEGEGPSPGEVIEGPTVLALPESTVLVPEGWAGQVDRAGTIRLERKS
jgi:N-methylhydantoinase A